MFYNFYFSGICERLSEPREDYNLDKKISNYNNLSLGADASFVALDDINARLEDLDSLDMGNVHGRNSRRFIKSKRSSRKNEDKDMIPAVNTEKTTKETSEETRYVVHSFLLFWSYS